MDQPLPWSHGIKKTRGASRRAARQRCNEALQEARSSLEKFSGVSAHKQSGLWSTLIAPFRRLPVGSNRRRSRGPATWIARWRERRGAARARGRASPRPAGWARLFSSEKLLFWKRFPAHAAILVLLVVLLLAGGFRGVLAQPVRVNQGGGSLAWYSLRSPDESEGTLTTYASIPAMPAVIRRPHVAAPDPDPVPEETETASYLPRTEVITYSVQEGDTLGSIASRFDLSVETLYWFNDLDSANVLSIDQALRIPPTDGLIHVVEEDDTLDSIAEYYDVRKGNMVAYSPNNLREPYTLEVDQEIFVPGAAKPIPAPAVSQGNRPSYIRLEAPPYAALPGGERFAWPAMGRVTDRFGWTGTRWHKGLDIAASWGTPIYAAAAGTVTTAGWKGSLGYTVAVDHGEGWLTRYGHMAQQPEVAAGQWVERGNLIGFIGCTGWCTGPHVHFEVHYQGEYMDPMSYLR